MQRRPVELVGRGERQLADEPGLLFLGLFAPAATPRPILDRIAEASRAAMADPEFQKVLVASGLEAVPDSNSEKAKRFIEEEIGRWGPVVKAAGFKVE